jgi:hypothetical protein
MVNDAATNGGLLPDKIMLVDGPLSGQVINRPDTGNAYVKYLPPGQVLPDADLPARFKVASYLVLRCERAGQVFWIGSTVVDPDAYPVAAALSLPEAEQCRERPGLIAEGTVRDD